MKPSRRLPPLNALRAFEAAARHLTFRAAAQELNVTQGAVAQQVRHLEDVLALPLFERLARGLALTADGRQYFHSVQRALQAIADATEELSNNRQAALTISATPSFAAKWLIPHLAHFSSAHPDIEVRIIAEERHATFKNDGVDLAIRLSKPPFSKGVRSELLFPCEVCAVCSPQLLRANGQTPFYCLEQLNKVTRPVLLHDALDLWPEFVQLLKEMQPREDPLTQEASDVPIDPYKGPRFSQTTLAIDAAIAGQGIALASTALIERDVADGRLCRLFDATLSLPWQYYIVRPDESRCPDAVAALCRWLLAQRKG